MRAKTLVLAGVLVTALVLTLRWSLATKGPEPEHGEETAPTEGHSRSEATPTPPSPPSPPPGPPPTPPLPPPSPVAEKRPDEGELLAEMRAALTADPARALRLAREAERRFGETAHAAERGRIAIEALVRLNDIAEARNAAEPFVRRHRGTEHARYVESLTGVHPRPSGPRAERPGPNEGASR